MLGNRRITSLAMDVLPLALPPATPTMYGEIGRPSASYHGWRPASVMTVLCRQRVRVEQQAHTSDCTSGGDWMSLHTDCPVA